MEVQLNKERNYWYIFLILAILMIAAAKYADGQKYNEIKHQSTIVRAFIIVDSVNFACFRSNNGFYYIEQLSKNNSWYRKSLGRYTETMYNNYKVFTNTKQSKYWYWTVDDEKKLHRHSLKLE